MKKRFLIFILLGFQCASTQYVDSKKVKGSKEWGPKEINETVDTMVTSLYNTLIKMNKDVYIAVDKIRNRTTEHIDTTLIANELTTRLVKKGIPFIEKSFREESVKEMELGQTGIVDPNSAISPGQLKSPNYELTGDITDNVTYENGKKQQFIIVTLKLVDVATTAIVWQERQEFMKVSNQEKYGW